MSLRILIVDDHDVVREGVRLILRRYDDWQICGEAENGIEALEKEKELKPDLIILDISMPEKDGLEVVADLRARHSTSKVLIFTMHESKELASAIKASGAKGYVVKTHAARDLAAAIRAIATGGEFFPFGTAQNPDDKPARKFPLFCWDAVPAFA